MDFGRTQMVHRWLFCVDFSDMTLIERYYLVFSFAGGSELFEHLRDSMKIDDY